MDYCIVRKVPYRLPGTKRLMWSIILAQREGLSLLFVKSPDAKGSHTLAVATENVAERGVFENVNAGQFPISSADLAAVTRNFSALNEHLGAEDFHDAFFRPEEWWQDD